MEMYTGPSPVAHWNRRSHALKLFGTDCLVVFMPRLENLLELHGGNATKAMDALISEENRAREIDGIEARMNLLGGSKQVRRSPAGNVAFAKYSKEVLARVAELVCEYSKVYPKRGIMTRWSIIQQIMNAEKKYKIGSPKAMSLKFDRMAQARFVRLNQKRSSNIGSVLAPAVENICYRIWRTIHMDKVLPKKEWVDEWRASVVNLMKENAKRFLQDLPGGQEEEEEEEEEEEDEEEEEEEEEANEDAMEEEDANEDAMEEEANEDAMDFTDDGEENGW